MRGEPAAAEASVTLQQPEARRAFSRGSCPRITGPWQWRAAPAPGAWSVGQGPTQATAVGGGVVGRASQARGSGRMGCRVVAAFVAWVWHTYPLLYGRILPGDLCQGLVARSWHRKGSASGT